MSTISIIHLSDLHISHSEFRNQSIVLQALWADIRQRREDGFTPDLVFFSGDLIAKGDYSLENTELARDKFIVPMLEAAGLPPDRLFIVPGNHDIQLPKRHRYVTSALDAITCQDQVRDFFLEAKRDPVADGAEGFNEFLASLSSARTVFSNAHYRTYQLELNGLNIGICAINTAWRSSGRPHDADYGRLIIGRHQLDEIIENVKECDLVFGLFHHPIQWLALFDSAIVRRQFYNNFDAVFYGHNHEVEGTLLAGSSGTYFASNAGCLYQHRDYFNGYSLVKYDPDNTTWNVIAREYFEARQVFDSALRFAPDGRMSYAVPRRTTSALTRLPTAEFISSMNDTIDGHLLSSLISEVAPKSLRSLFVDPPLSHLSQRQMQLDRKTHDQSSYISLKDVFACTEAIVFIGPKQSGKTTLLHRICLQSTDVGLVPFPAFAGYADLRHFINTEAKILDALLHFSGGAYRRAEFIDVLSSGLAVVCFDNLDDADDRQIAAVSAFISEYPNCRYFFSVLEKLESSLSTHAVPDLGIEMKTIYIHSFGRRETRELTARWFGRADTGLADKVDDILSSLVHLNIPRTPFLISALLWIKESNVDFSPVNRGAILDALIDGVLEKLTESKARGGVDSTIKRHFLAALAEHLYTTSARSLSCNELDSFTVAYFTNRALSAASGPFLQELQSRGVLLQVNDHISFKFDCIRAYFLAQRLRVSNELLDKALTPEEFLRFSEELDYLSGTTRDNADLLKRCLLLLQHFYSRADLELPLEFFDDVSVNNSPFKIEHQAEFTDRILGARLQGEKREELLDRLDGTGASAIGYSVERKRVPESTEPFPQFVMALQTASSVLRNSELIEDANLKHEAYKLITGFWSEVLIGVLIAVDFLEEDDKAIKLIANALPFDSAALASYLLKLLAPNVILSIALESLGTPKLQVVIGKSLSENQETVRQVLDTFLYLDLGLPDRFRYLGLLLERHHKNRFVSELVFFKVAQIYLLKRLSDEDERAIRDLLRKSLGTMFSSKTKVEKDRLKSRVLENFERKRIVQNVGE